jgi:hypothetical protein
MSKAVYWRTRIPRVKILWLIFVGISALNTVMLVFLFLRY